MRGLLPPHLFVASYPLLSPPSLTPSFLFAIQTLYPLVQHLPDFDDHSSVKSYNEILRCFEKLCHNFSDRLCVEAGSLTLMPASSV